jgi:hypothetical protein
MKKMLVVIAVVMIVIVLVAGYGPNVGEIGHIKSDDTRVVEDWNAISLVKPIACTLNAGDEATVLQYDTLILGSSMHETIVLVKHGDCEGWIFSRELKK